MSWWWPSRKTEPENVLYGFDLGEWDFLGTTETSYRNAAGEIWLSGEIAFFVSKDKTKRRFKLLGVESYPARFQKHMRNHPFHVKVAEQWRIGEFTMFHPVGVPSSFLNNYMLREHSMQYDFEQGGWVPADFSEAAKPIKRLRKRAKTRVKVKSDTNVIDFTKKD